MIYSIALLLATLSYTPASVAPPKSAGGAVYWFHKYVQGNEFTLTHVKTGTFRIAVTAGYFKSCAAIAVTSINSPALLVTASPHCRPVTFTVQLFDPDTRTLKDGDFQFVVTEIPGT